jgi:hypothetical protein
LKGLVTDMSIERQWLSGWGIPVPKYAEFDSKETLFGQAADLAAGIASTHFQREGIAGLVSRFEHVTYNGKRTGGSDIARITHELGRR